MLFLAILILTIICSYFLPWWFLAVIAFATAWFFRKNPGISFFAGFSGVFIAWTILALVKSVPNDNILATRVAHLFQLPNWWLLLIVTGFIGGLVGGMSALSATLIRKAFAKG
ncbi:hypothetical protein [Mucilaginibacter ginsenosidivorans]|uniref:Uncharacterized protein n=1 Tax=Mucilaginibacter ginsenosidivorans TaxID=398053 RepID=A0A5B8UZ36_9SPHI|nr:hypothetical protein [Mucilaginibacter ginsenosidivorans]QEC63853.1 hypothetical protein FRZ54_15140 [Mucilaginibacter ginsenosidivorans]